MTEVVTNLEVRYVDMAKLDALLRGKFGSNFRVDIGENSVEISTPQALTEAEVNSVLKNR